MAVLPGPGITTVAFREVRKSFGATRALDGVSFELGAGEVHVLAGENGAGKSTLIRILSGVYRDFSGELLLAGRSVRFAGPGAALRAGVATIHQELSLVGSMSVEDNLALGEAGSMWRPIDRRARRRAAERALAAMGLEVEPAAPLEELPLAVRQLVEIARALAQRASVVVMDEPTSALSEADAERLFGHVETLRERGVAVLFISHRMEEIYRIADRITVLRDGRHVATRAAADLPRDELIHMMVGRSLAARESVAAAELGPLRLEVPSLPLTVHGGEIVGVTGLLGSGASSLLYRIFGAPRRLIREGTILLSGDRAQSLIGALSVAHNVGLSALARGRGSPLVDATAERRAADRARTRLSIECPSLQAPVWQLSGGNQQKVALARCLEIEPQVLLLDEPTRGIDVGAKAEVHALIAELAAAGVAVLLVSSDLDELIALCHRVLVMQKGAVVRDLGRDELSRANILAAVMGGPGLGGTVMGETA